MANRKISKDDGLRLLKVKTLEKLTWQTMAEILGVKEPTLRQISCGRIKLSRKMCKNVYDHCMRYKGN